MPSQKMIEQVLIEKGFLTRAQLADALRVQALETKPLTDLLLSLSLLTPAQFAEVLQLAEEAEAATPSPVVATLPKLPPAGAVGVLPRLDASVPSAPASDEQHPAINNPRVEKAMKALEQVRFEDSLAETLDPELPIADTGDGPSTHSGSEQLRADAASVEETNSAHHVPKQPLQKGEPCPVCEAPQVEDSPRLCHACLAFLQPSPPNDKLVGQCLGERFLLNGRLGAGGMGLVYHATDQETGEFVACKILPVQLSTDEKTIRRFHLEAKVMLELSHPHIVRAVDYGFAEEIGCYMVMELLVGEELKDFLHRKPILSPQELVALFRQLCAAMQHAHDKGIVHRDLKPSNVFLLKKGDDPLAHAKIIDFGIARLTADDMPRHTVTGTFLGTPQYMSPEQAAAQKNIDHRSDIYTLGVMLYEMLAGRLPFVGDHIAQVLMHQIYMQPPLLSELRPELSYPPSVYQLIESVLAKKPDERPTSMDATFARIEETFATLEGQDWTPTIKPRITDEATILNRLSSAANTLLAQFQLPGYKGEMSPQALFEQLALSLRSAQLQPSSMGEVAVLMLSEEVDEDTGAGPQTDAGMTPTMRPITRELSGASHDELPMAPTQKTTGGVAVFRPSAPATGWVPQRRNDAAQQAEEERIRSQKRKLLFMFVFAFLFFSLLVVILWLNR